MSPLVFVLACALYQTEPEQRQRLTQRRSLGERHHHHGQSAVRGGDRVRDIERDAGLAELEGGVYGGKRPVEFEQLSFHQCEC